MIGTRIVAMVRKRKHAEVAAGCPPVRPDAELRSAPKTVQDYVAYLESQLATQSLPQTSTSSALPKASSSKSSSVQPPKKSKLWKEEHAHETPEQKTEIDELVSR